MAELDRFELEELSEGKDLEVKKAAGRDGKGELPTSFWETYSAMANSYGGEVLLGLEELPSGKFGLVGIQDIGKVKRTLFDSQANRQIVNHGLLTDKLVEEVNVQGRIVLRVTIPRARRSERPVYIGSNPLTGTFRRNNEGDYRCDEATVRRMLAEQMEEAPDSRLLDGFALTDLDPATLAAYRTQFKTTKPDHPWVDLENVEFLRCIGGWTKDRQSGKEGLTVAGILMFGKLRSILDAIPHYCVDYQERPEAKTEVRWMDRVTTDGTWSGNLFDFYRKVIQRLLADLKIPFHLEGDRRIDETLVHQALREALINTLIHADYSGRVPILVVKRPDVFEFRNPGMMRVPLEDAMRGGISDCRNRSLQKMFQLVGLAEQAGSGIPKIYQSWKQQSWRRPEFEERIDPEQTLLNLHTLSLLPPKILSKLDQKFGARFRQLTESQRLALVEIELEGSITHSRFREISSDHARDLTLALQAMVRENFLVSDGGGRKSRYFFPGEHPISLTQGSQHLTQGSQHLTQGSQHLTQGSQHLTQGSQHLTQGSQHLTQGSQHLTQGSQHLDPEFHAEKILEHLADPLRARILSIRELKKAPKSAIRVAILELCAHQPFSLKEMAALLNRSPLALQNHHLGDLVKQGRLQLRYPEKPNHPDQGYRSAKEGVAA